MKVVTLPDGHVWLRLTRPHYVDAFDTTFAAARGGRWNPPGSWPTLYVNENLLTVHAQLRHMFTGRGIEPDDLDDDAPIRLAACTLPSRQRVVDAVSEQGLDDVGLPLTYPIGVDGTVVEHGVTQSIGIEAHGDGFRGVWCRSAAGVGNELAWFPSSRSAARPVWDRALPLGEWRHAVSLAELAEPA